MIVAGRRGRVGSGRALVRLMQAALCVLAVLPAAQADPLTLVGAWQAAREHDPDFVAAQHERDAGLQSEAIGRAGLLPKVSAAVSRSQATGDRTVPTVTGGSVEQDAEIASAASTRARGSTAAAARARAVRRRVCVMSSPR